MADDQAGVLDLYDISGRLIRHLWQGSGSARPGQVSFDRRGLTGGVYFLKLQSGVESAAQRFVVVD